jgi:tRNA(Ile)-lysidine synthase
MSRKNLSVNKIPKVIKEKLLNKRIHKLYKLFEKSFEIKSDFIVAVSGGPDSLALAFLTKIYSIRNNLKCKYFIIDHKIRNESTQEAVKVKKILLKLSIKSEILTWKGKKPLKNIQSVARKNRYDLLLAQCNKFKIKNLILGHHVDDMFENFFIRMVRGSGLKGLISLGKKTVINKINIIRPLLTFQKKDLVFISSYVFNFFVKDPSNENDKYTRIRIRKLMMELQLNGLDKNKLLLTIKNLKSSDQAILFYTEKNKRTNSVYNKKKKQLLLNFDFFNQPYEIIFRSLSDSIILIGKMENHVRGKKIDNILMKIKNNNLVKETLGGCVIKKVNQTVILTKEH